MQSDLIKLNLNPFQKAGTCPNATKNVYMALFISHYLLWVNL
jgi:hypothetical protein